MRISRFPVVAVGTEYWKGLIDWLKDTVVPGGCVSPEDLDIFKVTDSPQEVVRIIKEFYKKHKA